MQTAVKGAGSVANELLGDLVRFPVWWYTTGVVHTATSLVFAVRSRARSLGIAVWIRNIFVPMYGQHDWQSRIISVFMRSAQIFFRSGVLVVWSGMLAVAFALYVALPLVAFAFVLYHAVGAFGIYG